MERRLAAILAADVADYSLLMNADESATYHAWRTARREVIDPCIDAHRGRIVKHTGDGFLAEFPTVLAAVECGVDIQTQLPQRDDIAVNGRALQFRIGINLGDIIVDEEDIHGDGVNIAARLEGIAEAGGVCISADVYNQVNNKSGLAFQDLGTHSLKNIAAPMRAYAVSKSGSHMQSVAASSSMPTTAPKSASPVESILEKAASTVHRRAGTVVGRVAEKEILASSFADAKQGNGNIVLLRGEAGIGKSSLAHAFTQAIHSSEAMVVYGQCHETLGSPPFWPWLQVLKSLQSSEHADQVPAANIFESLASVTPQATSSSHSTFSRNAGSEQFLLFSQIDSLLAQYASLRPLILVLDDLHWADRSSLLLLTHVCRRLSERSIQIVGTYRELEITRKHPLFESLGEINRQTTLRRIALKGLSEDDVAEYVRSIINQALPPVVLRSLYEKTEGNPLFMTEVTRLLQQETQRPTSGQFVIEIPDGIQEAIGQRLNELSDECNELLGMASVIGRNFSLRELRGLLPDTDELTLLQTLEEAVSRGIVNELSEGIASFQFCHVLIRDILYAELSLARRIVLHRKVADSLAQSHTAGADVSLGEIARHYYQALQGGQGDQAVHYAIAAAEHAMRLSAFDEARGYYEIALDVFSVDESRYATKKPQVLFHIVECLQGAGQPASNTNAMINQCLVEARKQGQHELFADAACFKTYLARTGASVGEGLKSIDEALTYFANGERTLRAKLIAHRALSLLMNSRRREAEQVIYEAVSVAAESGDAVVHCGALCTAVMVLRNRPEKLSDRIRFGELALELATTLGKEHATLSLDPREWLMLSYIELGDLVRVRKLITEQEAAVERSNEYMVFKSRYLIAGTNACLALFGGRWQEAEAHIDAAKELGWNSLDGGAEGVYGAQMFFLNRELGRLPMIHSLLQQMVDSSSAIWTPGLLATYTDLGLRDEAQKLAVELTANDFGRVDDDELYLTTLVYLSEACMEFDLSDQAAALYQRLISWSGQMVSHPTAVCYGPVDLYLAMLCSQMNRLDEAEQLFDKATALCERSAPNIWQAHVKYRHAQVLKRHNFKRR